MKTATELQEDQGKPLRPSSIVGLFTSLQKDLNRETGVHLDKKHLEDEKVWSENLHVRTRYFGHQTPFYKTVSGYKLNKLYSNSSVIERQQGDEWIETQMVVAAQVHGNTIHSRLSTNQSLHKMEDGHAFPPVQYAHYIETCSSCVGGKNKCDECHGRGRHSCYQCHGSKQSICVTCNGAKRNRCSSCYGSGIRSEMRNRATTVWNGQTYVTHNDTVYVNVPCTHCSSGYNTCGPCSGMGFTRCMSCDVLGEVSCRRCQGAGHLNCKVCDGSSELAHLHGVQTTVSVRHEVTSDNPHSFGDEVFAQKRFKDIQQGLQDFHQSEFKRDKDNQWSTVCHGRLTFGQLTLNMDHQSMEGKAFHNGQRWVWLPMEKIFEHLFKDLDHLILKLNKPWWRVTPWTAKKALKTALMGRAVHDHWKQHADDTKPQSRSALTQRLINLVAPPKDPESSDLMVDLGKRKTQWIDASRRGFTLRAKQIQFIWMVLFPLLVSLAVMTFTTVGRFFEGEEQRHFNELGLATLGLGLLAFIPGRWLHWHWTLHQTAPHDRFDRVYTRLFRDRLSVRKGWWIGVIATLVLGFAGFSGGQNLGFKLNPPPPVDWAAYSPPPVADLTPAKKPKKTKTRTVKPSEPIRYYGDFPPPADPIHSDAP